jgi:hypothetical protein
MKSAFSTCKVLEEIIIPENVTVIEESAFANCKALKQITIPDGDGGCYGCRLANVLDLETQ